LAIAFWTAERGFNDRPISHYPLGQLNELPVPYCNMGICCLSKVFAQQAKTIKSTSLLSAVLRKISVEAMRSLSP
jgi:hypothetical protein